jgi:hypothetical protein
VLAALPLALLCLAALAGLGLARELPAVTAIGVAAGAVLLGSLGAARLLGGRLPALGLSLAGVSAVLLTLMPLYQPGERAAAAERGLRLLGAPEGFSKSAAGWTALFGADRTPPLERSPPRPLDDWSAALPATPSPGAAPKRAAPPAPSPRDFPAADETLPLQRAGERLLVSVHLESRHGADDLMLIVDTGAAITTLTRDAAQAVELELSGESPVIFLNGVGGRSEARLTVVETLWLGDQAVGPLTVAVCDACLPGEGAGLLGIDVLGHFSTEIDADALRLALRRSPRGSQRDLVAPFLEVDARVEIQPRGPVLGEIEVRSVAPVDAHEVRVALECPEETFEFALDSIPSRAAERIDFALPWGAVCSEFRASVGSASWR